MASRKRRSTKPEAVFSTDLIAALKFDKYIASAPKATLAQLATLFIDCGVSLRESHRTARNTVVRYHFYDERRRKKAGTVWWKEGNPSIEVWGDATPIVVERLRAQYEHFVWEVDVCLDTQGGKVEYDRIAEALHAVQLAESRLQLEHRFDPKHPERGSRHYLGMQDSPGSVCLYQKGLQPGFRQFRLPDWNRLEWRLQLAQENRQVASTLSPLLILKLNATTRRLANIVLGLDLKALAKPPKAGKKCLDTLNYVCRTFPGSFRLAAKELGGIDRVLAKIGFSIDGQRWVCQPEHVYVMNRTGGTDVHQFWPWFDAMVKKSRQQVLPNGDLPMIRMVTSLEDVAFVKPISFIV